MSDIKNQLIKVGASAPELRPHLRKIIEAIEKTATGTITFGGESRLSRVGPEGSLRKVLEQLITPVLKQGGEDLLSIYAYEDDVYMAGGEWNVIAERGFVEHVNSYRYLPDITKSDLHRAGRAFYEDPVDAIFTSLLGNNLQKATVIAGAKPFASGGANFGHAYHFKMAWLSGFSEIEGFSLPDSLIPRLKQEFSASPDGKTKSI